MVFVETLRNNMRQKKGLRLNRGTNRGCVKNSIFLCIHSLWIVSFKKKNP